MCVIKKSILDRLFIFMYLQLYYLLHKKQLKPVTFLVVFPSIWNDNMNLVFFILAYLYGNPVTFIYKNLPEHLSWEVHIFFWNCNSKLEKALLFLAGTSRHINVWVTENTGKSRGYTESCCKYVTNPWLFTAIEDISLII